MSGEPPATKARHGVTVTITFTNDNPNTIWNRLAAELGREPTHQEARDRVRSILSGEGKS